MLGINNVDIRDRLERYIKENGVKQNFICKETGITPAQMSLFLNKIQCLNKSGLLTLCDFLSCRGY